MSVQVPSSVEGTAPPGAEDWLSGSSLLTLLTIGLHEDPLVIYREYLQNVADALEREPASSENRVEIALDVANLGVTIRDYGPGLNAKDAEKSLVPVARSKKVRGHDRGFRGIGRLSGLAYADTVSFLTRVRGADPVVRVQWHGSVLRECAEGRIGLEEAIRQSTSIDTVVDDNYPDKFFEVQLEGVSRSVAGTLLNQDLVSRYIGEVCPVPILDDFPFKQEIHRLLWSDHAPLELAVTLEQDGGQIVRPLGPNVQYTSAKYGHFEEFEPFEVATIEGDEVAAMGWFAHTPYLGAFPKHLGIRGVRARIGNMQIGSENLFDHLFSEERFNRWVVGEVHVLDGRIVPNGRRDYFELNPHVRHLENQLRAVLVSIPARCRAASSHRNQKRKVVRRLAELNDTIDLAGTGYLGTQSARLLIDRARTDIGRVEDMLKGNGAFAEREIGEIQKLKRKATRVGNRIGKIGMKGVDRDDRRAFRKVFEAIADASESAKAAKQTIEEIIRRS